MNQIKVITEFQKHIFNTVEQIFNEQKVIDPIVHFLFDKKGTLDYVLFPAGQFFSSKESKDLLVDVIRKAIVSIPDKKILCVMITSEAWAKFPKGIDKKEDIKRIMKNGIANEPDKREIVMVSYSSIINEGVKIYDIDRSTDNAVLKVSDASCTEGFNSQSLTGRFFNIVEKEFYN